MIRPCNQEDLDEIWTIINDGASAYRGIIPADRWSEPYMTQEKLHHEMHDGVVFWGADEDGSLQAVMGLQDVLDVTLIRHAYVRTSKRRLGLGSRLLGHLQALTQRRVLIGTWADASWPSAFMRNTAFDSFQRSRRIGFCKSIGRFLNDRSKHPWCFRREIPPPKRRLDRS
jgi:GNAT superfamily N-acetyltransferase